jgi:hypothetical protein
MVAVLAASLGVILGVAPIVIADYVQQEWKRISREDE